MKTIALRFGENIAPSCGTIGAHQELIDKNGFVWYGKFGSPISKKIYEEITKEKPFKILLIRSAKTERYWATVEEVSFDKPNSMDIPSYYRSMYLKIGCWFKIVSFKEAPKDIMAKCYVVSSDKPLTEASRHSMSPYFFIKYDEN